MGWWVGVKRGRRHPRHNLISDLSIDLIERLWPATRQPKRRTTTSKLLAIGSLSRMEWQMISFLSFLCLPFHPSIHLFRLLRLVLVSYFFFFSFFIISPCMFLCVLLTLLFYQIYSLLNQSPPLYIWTRLSQLYIRPAVCRDAGAAAVDTRPTGPSSGRPKKRTRESMHHPSYSVLSCAR